jgi:hypothetical protein
MMDAESIQRKMNDGVESMLERLSKSTLRPLQKDTYLRMAACFDSTTASDRQIQNCIQNSSAGFNQAQKVIESRMKDWEQRFERCVMVCQDEIKDKFKDSSPSPSIQREMEAQMVRNIEMNCVDKHLELLRSIESNLERDLSRLNLR